MRLFKHYSLVLLLPLLLSNSICLAMSEGGENSPEDGGKDNSSLVMGIAIGVVATLFTAFLVDYLFSDKTVQIHAMEKQTG